MRGIPMTASLGRRIERVVVSMVCHSWSPPGAACRPCRAQSRRSPGSNKWCLLGYTWTTSRQGLRCMPSERWRSSRRRTSGEGIHLRLESGVPLGIIAEFPISRAGEGIHLKHYLSLFFMRVHHYFPSSRKAVKEKGKGISILIQWNYINHQFYTRKRRREGCAVYK